MSSAIIDLFKVAINYLNGKTMLTFAAVAATAATADCFTYLDELDLGSYCTSSPSTTTKHFIQRSTPSTSFIRSFCARAWLIDYLCQFSC